MGAAVNRGLDLLHVERKPAVVSTHETPIDETERPSACESIPPFVKRLRAMVDD